MASTSATGTDVSRELYWSYLLTSDLSDLQQAVHYAQEVFDRQPPDAPPAPMIFFNLARPLLQRFLRLRQTVDISRALELFRCASELSTRDIPTRNMCCAYMILSFLVRHANLEGSIEQNDLHVCTLEGKVNVESLTRRLGEAEEVWGYYQSKSKWPDIEEGVDSAIQFERQALKFFSLPIPCSLIMKVTLLTHLGQLLYRRGTRHDKDEAIELYMVLFELPVTFPGRASFLRNASVSFMDRFQELTRQEDLDSGMTYARQAMANCNYQDFDYLDCLEHFAEVQLEFKCSTSSGTSSENLNFAIDLHQQALKFFSSASVDVKEASPEARVLLSLGKLWKSRHVPRSGDTDIYKALCCFKRCLKLPMMVDKVIICLLDITESFLTLFREHGRQEHLESAVLFAKEALKHTDSEGPDLIRVNSLKRLHSTLHLLSKVTGDMRHLDNAIHAARRAVEIAEQIPMSFDDSLLHDALLDLAKLLGIRSLRASSTVELICATEVTRRAVDLFPANLPRRIQALMLLSEDEARLGGALEDADYRERSLRHIREARCLYAQHGKLAEDLGFELDTAYAHRLSCINMWDEAIRVLETRSSTYQDFMSHKKWIEYVLTLGYCLFSQWTQTHQRELIDKAILITDGLLANSRGPNFQNLLGPLMSARTLLADCLHCRFEDTGDERDYEKAADVLLQAFQASEDPPYPRLWAGARAVRMLCNLPDCSLGLHGLSKDIVELFAITADHSLRWSDKQLVMGLWSFQVSTFAAVALRAGGNLFDVVDMLEICRGSILGQVIENRTDVDDLKKVAPEAAERFRALQDELNASIDTRGSMDMYVHETMRRGQAETKLRASLEEIRKLEGFQRFLRGPSQRELEAAAVEGPILVVNIASFRSDAIIVTKDSIVSVELPGLSYEKAAEFRQVVDADISDISKIGKVNKKIQSLLAWLWNDCVKLIFSKLDNLMPGTIKFHVWWIGIGIASSLPFHAAGIYSRTIRESALDRAISSYSPTLKILLHGRRKLKTDQLKRHAQRTVVKPKLLIVAMPTTPGLSSSDLQGVEDECEGLPTIVDEMYSVQIRRHPSARDTKELMERCEVVHFTCHGQVIFKDPSSSHLLLQTTDPESLRPRIDKLTVKDVAALNLSHGKLAFLAACSTADNPDSNLWDEGLHLASAFHVAGYLHTVGNLWPADDAVSVVIANGFYQRLVNGGELNDGQNVAQALNETLIDVSKRQPLEPHSWAQYVHFGV